MIVCVLSPVVIDMDGRIYVRPWQGGLLSGGFEKNPKPIFTEGRNQLEIQNMQEDWDHFGKGGRGKDNSVIRVGSSLINDCNARCKENVFVGGQVWIFRVSSFMNLVSSSRAIAVILAYAVLPEPMLNSLLRRMPALESAEIHQLVNCPESFTPDMRCLMGETPGVSGYYVLAGMNSSGLSFAGGAGK